MNALAPQFLPEEGNRMLPKRQPFRPVVLHDLPALGHGRELDLRFIAFRPDLAVPLIGCCKEGKGFIRKASDRPESIAPTDLDRSVGIRVR